MEEKRRILIITDDSDSMRNLAVTIAAIIRNPQFAGCTVSMTEAESFSAPDLLPAQTFFLGCEKPGSFSFLYIEDLFAHINLAGKFCGIFSNNSKAVKYLSVFIRDSEVSAGKPLLVKDSTLDNIILQNWVKSIMQQGGKNERI